jgi:hypothetical protein
MLISSDSFFAVTGATGTGVNLMSIPQFHGGPLPTL